MPCGPRTTAMEKPAVCGRDAPREPRGARRPGVQETRVFGCERTLFAAPMYASERRLAGAAANTRRCRRAV